MRKKNGGGKGNRRMPKYRPYQTAVFVGACSALAAALLIMLRVGSTVGARHCFRLPGFFPPTWLLFVCGGISCAMMGGILGRGGWCLCSAYYLPVRGVLFLFGFAFLRLCWYPVFFGLFAPLSSCGVLAAALCLGVCGALQLGRRLPGLWPVMLCQMGWSVFLLVNSFAVFLLN